MISHYDIQSECLISTASTRKVISTNTLTSYHHCFIIRYVNEVPHISNPILKFYISKNLCFYKTPLSHNGSLYFTFTFL